MIDGYNVTHSWPELHQILNFDLTTACTHLANAVQIIHDSEHIHTTLVFDGKGNETTIERPSKDISFSLVYTCAELTADSFIEQYVQRNKKKQMFIIVSRDNLLIETISALDATAMRPKDLKAWVNECSKLQSEKIKRHTKKTNKQWKLNDSWEKIK